MVKSTKVRVRIGLNTKRKAAGKNSKRNIKRTSVNKRHSRKRQRGGNRVMISKLCDSSKKGSVLQEVDSVSAAYVEELCNSPPRNKKHRKVVQVVTVEVSYQIYFQRCLIWLHYQYLLLQEQLKKFQV